MKLEEIVWKIMAGSATRREYEQKMFVAEIKQWARGHVPKKLERDISCYSASNRRGRESVAKQMLKNIEKG